jgi:hypothetical protein
VAAPRARRSPEDYTWSRLADDLLALLDISHPANPLTRPESPWA